MSFLWRHKTKDVTKNHPLDEGLALIDGLLGRDFQQAHLDTLGEEVQLRFSRKGKPLLQVGKKAGAGRARRGRRQRCRGGCGRLERRDGARRGMTAPSPGSCRPAAPFWRDLGVTHELKGQPTLVPAMARKWKQINKFIEVLRRGGPQGLALDEPGTPVRVADFGSGKGYLTFAMHD